MTRNQNSAVTWIIFSIIVIVFAAILIPKYSYLSKQLRIAKAQNVASTLASSSASNYTQRKFNIASGIAIKNCNDVRHILGNNLATGYVITDLAVDPDKVAICTLSFSKDIIIPFSVIGVR